MNDQRSRKPDPEDEGQSNRPIHSKGDIHDTNEGMPLTLAAGGYGGTPRTAKKDETEERRHEK